MEIYAKIVGFVIVELVLLALLYAFPRSGAARLAFTWYGPFPADGETYAHYRVRRALWVFTLFCQLFIIVVAGAWAIRTHPSLQGTWLEHGLMVLSGAGWVVLGCILWYLATAAKAAVFGPNPSYEVRTRG